MLPLLLLPGLMCDGRIFSPQIEAVASRWPVMSVPFGTARSMSGLATEILSYAPPKFALAGLSMGGIVAMEMLRLAPERIDRIGLFDTSELAEPGRAKEMRERQMKAVRAGDLRRVMRDEMKPNYLADGPANAAILDLFMDMAETLGPDAFERQSIALRDRRDQTETLRNFEGPALVLCGAEDKLCPVSRHQMMAELLGDSTLHVIENAGHIPTLENPDATNEAVIRWMER